MKQRVQKKTSLINSKPTHLKLHLDNERGIHNEGQCGFFCLEEGVEDGLRVHSLIQELPGLKGYVLLLVSALRSEYQYLGPAADQWEMFPQETARR